jgi:hypothetical protein
MMIVGSSMLREEATGSRRAAASLLVLFWRQEARVNLVRT